MAVCVCVRLFPCRRKVEIMHTHSLFTLLGERLMMHTNTVSITTYNTLYEVGDCSPVAHSHCITIATYMKGCPSSLFGLQVIVVVIN